mgnify:CR=1 FL=1|tara:strand:+ start:2665 stop:3204 length:540 start_codon:yes stop_codon:yes gene_type:complete
MLDRLQLLNKITGLVFCICMLNFSVNSQNNPFSIIDSDSIVVYEYDGLSGLKIEDALESQPNKIINSAKVELNVIKGFERAITDSNAYGNTTAACFDPHLGIVYWKKDSIMASISICLDCNYLESSKDILSEGNNQIVISEDYSYPAKGFSKETRKFINDFCLQLGFTKYLEPLESIFD